MNWPDVRDWVWPLADPPSVEDKARDAHQKERQLDQAVSAIDSDAITAAYEKLIEAEDARLKSVEGRLGSLLGLTSIAAGLLVGGTLALDIGSLSNSSRMEKSVAGLGVLYLSMQIVLSTLAAIRGLKRDTWLRPGIDDMIPDPQIEPTESARNQARTTCARYQLTQSNINAKVTHMEVAHTAIRNFAVGSAIVAFLGTIALLVQNPGNAVVAAIRKDASLQQLLRGPQGPPGPQGPAVKIELPKSPLPCAGTPIVNRGIKTP